jgi:pimeloyl-ACP methyl ester carboxylesterase
MPDQQDRAVDLVEQAGGVGRIGGQAAQRIGRGDDGVALLLQPPDDAVPAGRIGEGAGDTAVPPVNARFLHERLPNSKLDIIDAGHFTWEDAPAEYADLVTSWWRSAANGSRK